MQIFIIFTLILFIECSNACPNHCTCSGNKAECCIFSKDQEISEVNEKCKQFFNTSVDYENRGRCQTSWQSLTVYLHPRSFHVNDVKRSYDVETCTKHLSELTITGTVEDHPRDNLKILNTAALDSFIDNGLKLNKMTISHVELHEIDDGLFHKMNITQLEQLSVKYNPYLKKLGHGTFLNLENLKDLELQGNHLKTFDLYTHGFYSEYALQTLDLSDNKLEEIDSLNFPSLVLIKLDNNRLKALSSSRFRNATGLKHLSLRNNNIAELFGFLNEKSNYLDSLIYLDISGNPIFSQNSIPYWFRDGCPTRLKKIIAKNISLDTSTIAKDTKVFSVNDCNSLREIDLSGNIFSGCLDLSFFGVDSRELLTGVKIKPEQLEICHSEITLPPLKETQTPILSETLDDHKSSSSEEFSKKNNAPFYILLVICSLAFFLFLVFTIVVITCLRKYKKISNSSGNISSGGKKGLDEKRPFNGHYIAQGTIPSVPSGFVTITPNELNDSTIFVPTNEYNPGHSNGLIHHNDNEYLYATSMYNASQLNRNSSSNGTPSDEMTPKDDSNCSSSFNDSGFNQTMIPNTSTTHGDFYKVGKHQNLVTSVSTFFPKHQVTPQPLKNLSNSNNRPESICITSQNGVMYSSMMSLNHLQLPNNTLPKSRTILHQEQLQVPSSLIPPPPAGYTVHNPSQRVFTGLVNVNGNVSHFYRQSAMSTSQDSHSNRENRVSIVL